MVDVWDLYYYHDEMNIVHYLVRVYFEFDTGNFEVREYELYIEQIPDGSPIFTLVMIGMQISVPADAILLDEADTTTVLTRFALDYSDDSFTHQELCDLYFAGVMN